MSRVKLTGALTILIVASAVVAVPNLGTVHFQRQRGNSPDAVSNASNRFAVAAIRFRDERDRGLLVSGWINGIGPFVFVLDTGAGVSILSQSTVNRVGLVVSKSKRPLVGGLSRSPIASDLESRVRGLALGTAGNSLPATFVAAVVPSLPGSIDGILDPTEVFSPFGYSVDLPNRELLAFDAKDRGLSTNQAPPDGTVVRWLREPGSDRPYVKLGDGRLALIDTGSGFGLALNEGSTSGGRNHGGQATDVRDLGGGVVTTRRVEPVTVNIGALVLKGVPTDILFGVPRGTPVILGRRALYPFKITFDPVARLIAIEPSERH